MIQPSAVGQKWTAGQANALIAAANAIGLSLVDPASVAGTGVVASALGKIAFSGSTSVNVDGVFTTAYDNYLIKVDATMSTTASINMVLRSGGTDSTAANYDSQFTLSVGTTAPASGQTLAGSNWFLSAAAQVMQKITLELDGPALSASAFGTVTASASQNPMTAAAATAVRTVMNRLTSPFDGFTLNTSSGSMTGSVRVYGYNNG